MKIGLGSDHAGCDLKEFLKEQLKKEGYEIRDYGPELKKSVDYPDFAEKVAMGIKNKEINLGILICGTGIGMSIAANRYPWIRAARACTINDALLAREHNNANILALGGRLTGNELAMLMVKTFIETPFLKGRHMKRVNKLKRMI
ncbi:MAG TPA: ribose 5-phosphate isomerase B [bacterium]|nr:ribose 5-phosphate isomerase B [bacterium]